MSRRVPPGGADGGDEPRRSPPEEESDVLEEPAVEGQETVVMDVRPTRRSFWQSLVPGSEPAAKPEPSDEWLRFVKRTLAASATRKTEE